MFISYGHMKMTVYMHAYGHIKISILEYDTMWNVLDIFAYYELSSDYTLYYIIVLFAPGHHYDPFHVVTTPQIICKAGVSGLKRESLVRKWDRDLITSLALLPTIWGCNIMIVNLESK